MQEWKRFIVSCRKNCLIIMDNIWAADQNVHHSVVFSITDSEVKFQNNVCKLNAGYAGGKFAGGRTNLHTCQELPSPFEAESIMVAGDEPSSIWSRSGQVQKKNTMKEN